MQTQCVRCHKVIDTVQGYKFSSTEYLCMGCYDEYKAERTARARKEHKNPLMDRFGKEGAGPAVQEPRPAAGSKPQPATTPVQPKTPLVPERPAAPESVRPAPPVPEPGKAAPTPPPTASTAELCDVCKKPIGPFKVPLKGGKKVCMDCNNLLREIAKSLIVNMQCPHCGKEIQIAQN